MASGPVNRIKRPNTWLHRPMLQNVKKALANPEPSTHGTFETCRSPLTMSVSGGRPEVAGRLSKRLAGRISYSVALGATWINKMILWDHRKCRQAITSAG
jgi:hypothetical protein